MAKDKMVDTSIDESPDLMTVEDYARVANVNAIMLAGFKVDLKGRDAKPWRTRGEWKQALEAFGNSPS